MMLMPSGKCMHLRLAPLSCIFPMTNKAQHPSSIRREESVQAQASPRRRWRLSDGFEDSSHRHEAHHDEYVVQAAGGSGPGSGMSEIKDGMSPMPLLPITSAETLRNCKMSIKPHDIFVCSYPKSGTTWMQNIVFQLLTKAKVPLTHISDFLPFYEVDRTWEGGEVSPRYARGRGLLGRRCFNTHLRWSMLPTEGSGSEATRFIYVVRHGKDVCTSYYHHMKSMAPKDGGFDGTWDEFCSAFLEGAVAFGSRCDHLVSWIGGAASKDDRVLILRYEEMKSDLRGCAERVARHIGAQLTPDEMEEAVGRMTFDYMKQHAEYFNPRSVEWTDRSFEFIRRGVVGDHRSLFTPQQHAMFEEMIKRRFGSDVPEYILDALKEEG